MLYIYKLNLNIYKNMRAQAWISVVVFASAIIFSTIMASISPTFRWNWRVDKVLSGIIFFIVLIVTAVFVTLSAHCAVDGKSYEGASKTCQVYSWIIVILMVILIAMFITKGILDHIDEKKEVKATNSVSVKMSSLKPTIAPFVLEETA